MSKLQDTFNWLAERPKHNYTLGEIYQRFVQNKNSIIEDNRLGFSRLGRAWERSHTIIGALGSAAIIAYPPAGMPLAAVFSGAGLYLWVWKTLGVCMGKIIDHTVRYKFAPSSPSLIEMVKQDIDESKKRRQQTAQNPKPPKIG